MRRRRRYLAGLLLCSALVAVPEAAPAASGRTTTVKLSSDGEARVYRVFDPAGRDAKKPAALIVALHGAGGNGAKFQRRSGWDDVAERAGALVAYPSSFERGWRNNGDVDVRFLYARHQGRFAFLQGGQASGLFHRPFQRGVHDLPGGV